MKCNRCGAEVVDGQINCPRCGNMMQSGISMTHVGQSGQTITGAITSNGAALNVSAAPIKNSKVALVVSLVVAAVSVIVLGVGIFLAVRGGNSNEGGKTDVGENTGSTGNAGGVGSGSTSNSGYHMLDCVWKGKMSASQIGISMSFVDGDLSVIAYNAVIDPEASDEVTFAASMMVASFEPLKGEFGVISSNGNILDSQVIAYQFDLEQMSEAARGKLLGDNFRDAAKWSDVDKAIKELEAQGFSCTKE